MKKLILLLFMLICFTSFALAADMPERIIRYDYVVPTETIIIEPAPVEVITVMPVVPVEPVPVCWYEPDPYTFLGEVFGYDYYYVCR